MKNNEIIFAVFEGKTKGIAIDPKYCDQYHKISKINYPNFRYAGQKNIENKGIHKDNLFFIEIFNLPENLIEAVAQTINDIINNDALSVPEALDEIFKYFSKIKFKDEIAKKLYGDIGEALFILKVYEKYNINLLSSLRNEDKDLYDFKYNDLYIEVKSSSIQKNDFILTNEQLNEIKEKKICIVKFKKVQDQTTIIDLYNEIDSKLGANELIAKKRKEWEYLRDNNIEVEGNYDIIKNYSIIKENVKYGFIKNNSLPVVKVVEKNACKEIIYKINCTDDILESLDIVFKH